MPKLSMEIEPVESGLPVDSYLQKPALPSSTKPVKKKRVMSEKQLANLAKAREKSCENRRLKKEAKLAEKAEKKLMKKKGKKSLDTITETEETSQPPPQQVDYEIEEEEYAEEDGGDNGVDYEFIMANVYGMLKEDEQERKENALREQAEKLDWTNKKNAYDENIRAEERERLKGIVEEKRKHKKAINPMTNGNDWDSCFQPRGRGGDNFF